MSSPESSRLFIHTVFVRGSLKTEFTHMYPVYVVSCNYPIRDDSLRVKITCPDERA